MPFSDACDAIQPALKLKICYDTYTTSAFHSPSTAVREDVDAVVVGRVHRYMYPARYDFGGKSTSLQYS